MSIKFISYRLVLLCLLLLAAWSLWRFLHPGQADKGFRTAEISRGNLELSISATGVVQPEEVVDVGAQVAGQIIAFGTDQRGKPIDYGSVVSEEMILAKIDDSLYAADVAEAQAQLKLAQANYLQAQAKFAQAERDWLRAQKLGASAALAQTSYDAYRAAYDMAKAGLAVSEASIAQAEASLGKAKRNLSYCIIKSPVSGVIIDRRVDIGQTVVASLNAPSLFLIAKDLKRVEIWVAVNEADIGSISPGQAAIFTVDAFPGEIFKATVEKIRLNATMTQNVVTYTVELITDNTSGRLLPYLTANVRFEVGNRQNILRVPNAALRWVPKAGQFRGSNKAPAREENPQIGASEGQGTLWLPEGSQVRPITVKIGVSDGVFTEVEGAELAEGMQVVLGERSAEDNQRRPTNNPFAPVMNRGKGR